MPRERRGGKRTPANPAPVSGPGSLSRRTDGQPVRSFPANFQGQRKALEDQQQAAPLAAGGTPGVRPTGGAPPVAANNVFGPSERPQESGLQGAIGAPGQGGTQVDPDLLLRAIYAKVTVPQIGRLIRNG